MAPQHAKPFERHQHEKQFHWKGWTWKLKLKITQQRAVCKRKRSWFLNGISLPMANDGHKKGFSVTQTFFFQSQFWSPTKELMRHCMRERCSAISCRQRWRHLTFWALSWWDNVAWEEFFEISSITCGRTNIIIMFRFYGTSNMLRWSKIIAEIFLGRNFRFHLLLLMMVKRLRQVVCGREFLNSIITLQHAT